MGSFALSALVSLLSVNLALAAPAYEGAPACEGSNRPTVTKWITFTTTASPPRHSSSSACVPVTKCEDRINSCGIKFGGCFNTCDGPNFTTPTCPPSATFPSTITRSSSSATPSSCTAATLCVDLIDKCGQLYGGCYNTCSPSPTWSTPFCNTATLPTTPRPSSSSTCRPATLCVDYIDKCHNTYGGCYNTCSPSPTWSTPFCASVTSPVTPRPTCTAATLCVDLIDKCGQTYGGCFDTCSGTPTFTPPSCSLTATSVSASPTTY